MKIKWMAPAAVALATLAAASPLMAQSAAAQGKPR